MHMPNDNLLEAISNNDLDALEAAILAGANVNVRSAAGWSALMLAQSNRCAIQILKSLLDAGADVDMPSLAGKTPILYAADEDHYDYLELMLKYSPNLQVKNRIMGWSPLAIAAQSGHFKMTNALIKHGAIVDALDDFHGTPLMHAAGNNNLRVIKLLLDAGAAIDIQDKKGQTALIRAANKDCKDCIIALVEAGADISLTNETGETALAILEKHGDHEMIAAFEMAAMNRAIKTGDESIAIMNF